MTPTSEIERVASQVVSSWGGQAPPVDVCAIAREEGIELAPGGYGESFCGRIEFHPGIGKFILFHPELSGAPNAGRVRFSISHELGHYFLDRHREALISGQAHNSDCGFICDAAMEREADEFAAALLIPEYVLKRKLSKRDFMTLEEILRLADDWETSATSAAIRYAKYTGEACAVVISADGLVKNYIPSEEAQAIGFRFLGGMRRVPAGSGAAAATASERKIISQKAGTSNWFSGRSAQCELWEESIALGYTGLVLTLLAFSTDEQDEE